MKEGTRFDRSARGECERPKKSSLLPAWDDPEWIPRINEESLAIQKEKIAHRRKILEANRQTLRESFWGLQSRRLQLEARCGLNSLSSSTLFAQYGIVTPEPTCIATDHDKYHVERAQSRESNRILKRLEHREYERAKLATRKVMREQWERKTLPLYQSIKLQGYSPTSSSFSGKAKASQGLPLDHQMVSLQSDLNAIQEADTIFHQRCLESKEVRFSGKRTLPSFNLSTNHRELTRSVFTTPIYN